ncbi:diacylglycerol O-acyltransferase 1 [Hypoxylon texense]
MRPRLFSRRLVPNFHGIVARRYGSQRIAAEKLTLTLPTKVSKQAAVDELKRHRLNVPSKSNGISNENSDYEAAIFASPGFATWLEDETFMSIILETLFGASSDRGGDSYGDINVISAVADGLTPKRLFGESQTGFSILYGSKPILPDLWNDRDFGSSVNQDRESSVSFLSRPLPGNTGPLETTLPLANTIFQNGRRSTLFASKWQRKSSESMTLATMREKPSQTIHPPIDRIDHTHPLIPLLPLTPPRKVVAGLGNIVRQVEINGSSTPASKELESLIPKVFDIRSKLDENYTPRPIGVWCWVIPPNVVDEQDLFNLKVFQAESTQSEAELSVDAMPTFSKLISSKCRLHKILSGGGGWGLKQGLLSLDPMTNYSLSEQDDIDMFIKAFQERGNPSSPEGLVTPGSYLMFCIEPHWTKKEARSSQQLTPATSLGVASNNDEDVNLASPSDKIEVVDDHFGIVSKSGLFLNKESEAPNLAEVVEVVAAAAAVADLENAIPIPATAWILPLPRPRISTSTDPLSDRLALGASDFDRWWCEWVHDRFDDAHSRDRPRYSRRQRSPEPLQDNRRGTKIKVENLHYDLTEDDLYSKFSEKGPVRKFELLYDRAGRSEGIAFVTYETANDAAEAVKDFDGANANGQEITVTQVRDGPPQQRRNPFDTAHMPGRPLAERITRRRSFSPRRPSNRDRDRDVDRYVPGGGNRSRSPLPRRRGGGGRRPGARREGREGREGRDGRETDGNTPNGRERTGRDGRPKKTQEELDAEMADYFNPGASNEAGPVAETTAQAGDDMDMIE